MTFELPLFPLNVVLFPGMRLPLHIFEPRYRLMIRRCLEADRAFGVALIVEGEEGHPDTVPAQAGCTAEILESTPFADGRMNLMTVGRRRFRVLSTREEDGYLVGTVQWLDDPATGAETALQASRVRRMVSRYLSALAQNAKVSNLPVEELDIPDDSYRLSMWIAALIPLSTEQQQHLLEMESTADRLDLEFSLLRRAEIVQLAYAKRANWNPSEPAAEEPFGPYSQFVSLN